MLTEPRQHTRGESGFTLVELLVVILIIGILGAIVVPSFMTQRQKAKDAAAKEGVLTMRTAIETYATDHDGTYFDATVTGLREIEPTLNNVNIEILTVGTNNYDIQARSTTDTVFQVHRGSVGPVDGVITRTCAPAGSGGCPASGSW